MTELIEVLKNTFAAFGVICFSSMAIVSVLHLYDLVRLYGFKEGLKRWVYNK